MINGITKKEYYLDYITTVSNAILWVMLLPSMFFAYGSLFAADAGVTSKLQETLLMIGIIIAFHSPIIILSGAIISLILRNKRKYILSLIFEFISLGSIILSISFFIISAHIR